MRKRKALRLVAIVAALVLLLVNWSTVAIAEDEGTAGIVSAGETPLLPEEGGGEGSEMGTRDVTFGNPVWCTLKTSATVYYAPYGTGCASTGYTLAAGKSVYLYSRDYDYFYVCWYINNREMFGYIAMSAINLPSTYSWTQYDIYKPGTCTGTTQVLSYAGTTSTYFHIGNVTSEKQGLMVLGQTINPYNNKKYYFIQYLNNSGLVMRGWVDSTLGTVTVNNVSIESGFDHTNQRIIRNRATNRILAWNPITDQVEQQFMNGSIYQLFRFERSYYNGTSTGYYQIVSMQNSNMSFRVSEKGFAEGLSIYMDAKGNIDKRQEFHLEIADYDETTNTTYVRLSTRSTGNYRYLTADGTENLKQSVWSNSHAQQWEIIYLSYPWDNGYERAISSGHPGTFNLKVESAVLNYMTLDEVQECIDRWNILEDYYFDIQAVVGTGYSANTLAVISVTDLNPNGYVNGAILGQVCPVLSSSESFSNPNMNAEEEYDSSWYTSRLFLDFEAMEDVYSSFSYSMHQRFTLKDLIIDTVVHELGHCLKLTHPFVYYDYNSQDWLERSYFNSVMNSGNDLEVTVGCPQAIDHLRFRQKWIDE